jgi:hypothetical protein
MTLLHRRAFVAVVSFIGPLTRAAAAFQPSPISLDEFIALSSRLTGHTDLNRTAADVFLKGLLATPGNAAKLRQPDAGLERDIIVAWYTGAHDVRGERQLATHAGALKWRAVGVPVPGTCAGRFGAWAQPSRLPNR